MTTNRQACWLAVLLGCVLACAARAGTEADEIARTCREDAIREAIKADDLDAFKQLVAGDLDANQPNESGYRPLTFAASAGRTAIIKYLLAQGAQLNAEDPQGQTPIHDAVMSGKTETAKFLYEAAAVLDAPSAAAVGDVKRLRELVEADADLLTRTWYFFGSHDERTIAQLAACHGSVEGLRALAELGADMKYAGDDGFTVLYLAAVWGHADAVDQMLKYDDRINQASRYGWTPLSAAAYTGKTKVVELLLKRGATEDIFAAAALGHIDRIRQLLKADRTLLESQVGFTTPVGWAAKCNQPEAMEVLLDAGAAVNANPGGESAALQLAAWEGHEKIVKLLLDRNAYTEAGAGTEAYGTPLHRACWQNHRKVVDLLLDAGANIDSVDNSQEAPLCFAVKQEHLDLAKHLLERGANVNGAGSSPLASAAWDQNIAMAKLLVDAGADVNGKQGRGTALHIAAQKGNVELVDLLLTDKVDKTIKGENNTTPLHLAAIAEHTRRHERPIDDYLTIVKKLVDAGYNIEEPSYGGYTVLARAVHESAPLAMIDLLIARGANVNARTGQGMTALHVAARRLRPDIIAALLKAGADVDAKDKTGSTPLAGVITDERDGAGDIVKQLVEAGAATDAFMLAQMRQWDRVREEVADDPSLVVQSAGGGTLLHSAARQGNLAMAKWLIDRGAAVDDTSGHHTWTPLHAAAAGGHADVVSYLLAEGAQVDPKAMYNQGPLYNAAMSGHVETVKVLLKAGADPNRTTSWSYFPLTAAADGNHPKVIDALLDGGADIRKKAKENTTALAKAVERGSVEAAEVLLRRGATLDEAGSDYSPPLHDAASRGSLKMIAFLLAHEAPINRMNDRGDTALDCASSNGKTQAAKVLREAGALYGRELFEQANVMDLVKQLGDDDWAKREAAQKTLKALGPRLAALLRRARASTDDAEIHARIDELLKQFAK